MLEDETMSSRLVPISFLFLVLLSPFECLCAYRQSQSRFSFKMLIRSFLCELSVSFYFFSFLVLVSRSRIFYSFYINYVGLFGDVPFLNVCISFVVSFSIFL